MDKNTVVWADVYAKTSGRQPRELLLEVLKRCDAPTPEQPRYAIDLGSGDGTESAFLLAQGWHVLAIDSEPAAVAALHAKITPALQANLQTQVATFDQISLHPADLIYAGYSVPYCDPQQFDALWATLKQHVKAGGLLAGQLFGVNDTWATNSDMSFFTREQAQALFGGFDVEYFREEDEDGASTIGMKHWHVFHVIARKK